MKRISYIVFGVAFLALASCQKEVFQPNDPARNSSDIELKSSEFSLDKDNGKRSSSHDKVSTDPNAASSGNTGGTGNEGSTDDSGITDPNNDPDAAKKKGKK
ncbi:MAG: hypothetical protein K0R65_1278 [Crocinitomicaceae bacterium]|jgi:hypothetical protein|nr:hypothetical protein [Crocinitomicaceae bacterium]